MPSATQCLLIGFLAIIVAVKAGAQSPTGTSPDFQLDLSTAKNLPPGAAWVREGPDGNFCLRVSVPADQGSGTQLVTVPIDLAPLRDHEILLSYAVRAQDVSRPEKDYNGIKCQLHWKSPTEGPRWFNEGMLSGTFDWRRSSLLIRVDADAADGELQIGLQECSGTAWIADVSISIIRKKPSRPGPIRGVVSPNHHDPQDLADLAAWNVNGIRWQLNNPDWNRESIPSDPEKYGAWLGPKLDELSRVLDQAQSLGIKVIIDLHAPPGGRLPDGTQRMLLDKPLQEYFIAVWQHIAERFKGHPALWAYDIMNEPLQNRPSPPGVMDWFALQEAAAKAVRAMDPQTPIMIEADQWDSPPAFAWMRPVDVPDVIYQVHMYWPYEYTHQGIDKPWESEADKPGYPGTFNGLPFNREALIRHLAPVRDFQRSYHARIFVGEFSAVRWAPGAAQYLQDCIAIFEAYGWDWTYHAFREWPGWSVEHENLPQDNKTHQPAKEMTDRRRVLQSWFDRNQRPNGP